MACHMGLDPASQRQKMPPALEGSEPGEEMSMGQQEQVCRVERLVEARKGPA